MKLMLDQTQRLNLQALIGAQRASVEDMRLWWRILDKIEVSEKEKKRINFRVTPTGNGMEQAQWDVEHVAAAEYDFSVDEVGRLQKLIKEWPGFNTGSDRRWLAPLLDQFDHEHQNGQQKT